jgi:outer membrane lipoprotein SlyB
LRRHSWLWFGIFVAALFGITHMALAQPPGGGGRGRGGRPFEVGKVATVSEDGKTITIASEFVQNATATVTASDQTLYYTAWDVELKDIAVGDTIALRGTPVKIQVDTAEVGTDLQSLMNPPGPGGAAAPTAPATPAAPRPAAFGMVTGTVAKTDPLTVNVNDLEVEVVLAEGATLTKIAPMDKPAVAVGDRVIVAGSRPQGAGPETPLAARVILVDTTAKGLQLFRGFGGRGGRGGPGGRPG